jgi:hypothetical protein
VGWLGSRPVVLVLGTLLGCYLFDAAWPAFGELIGAAVGRPRGDHARLALNGELRMAAAWLSALWGLAVASAAAVSITSEREANTWESLAATLLTGPEVVRGKILGALWSARRLALAVAAVVTVGVLGGAVHPAGAVASGLVLAASGGLAAALGVAVSVRARNSTRALAVMVVALVVAGYLGIGLGSVATSLTQGPEPGTLGPLLGFAPAAEWASLVSYREFDDLREGHPARVGESPVAYRRDVLLTLGLLLAAASLAAFGLYLLAVRSYDRAAGRPRRAGEGAGPGREVLDRGLVARSAVS